MHFGHIKHLEKAKSLGDLLIVSITASKYVNKGPDRPFFSNEERLKVISSLSIVDFIYLNNDNLSVNIIKKLKPNIYVKGNDYKINKKDVTGGIVKEINALNRINSKIIYTDEIVYSSTNLINRFLLNYNDSQKNIISTIKKKINIEDINKILNPFPN